MREFSAILAKYAACFGFDCHADSFRSSGILAWKPRVSGYAHLHKPTSKNPTVNIANRLHTQSKGIQLRRFLGGI